MERREPPDEWEIWLASYGGTDYRELAMVQNGGHLDFTPIRGPGEPFSGYAQTTFVGMGGLSALVVADDMPWIDFNVGTFARIARKIWPIGSEFSWPLDNVLTDDGADSAAGILNHMVANFRDNPA